MKNLIYLSMVLVLSACAPKQNDTGSTSQSDNQLKEPSHALCVSIEHNTTDAIFGHISNKIVMFNGQQVLLMGLDGSIEPMPDQTLQLGFCKIVVLNMTISEVIYE